MKRIYFFWVIIVLWAISETVTAQDIRPTMVWNRETGSLRNEMLYFRRDVTLASAAQQAILHVYADSRYALYVNETYLGFGPLRSYHKNPYYDTHDITPYLKKGKNVIALKVLSNGMQTYQLYDNKGGFSSWGNIVTDSQNIDLNVTKGWKVKSAEGVEQDMPRLSFAAGAIEVNDYRLDTHWNSCKLESTEAWSSPKPLKAQDAWGKFHVRHLPYLTNEKIAVEPTIKAYPVCEEEKLYSFRIPVPDYNLQEYNRSYQGAAYTYIYSPKAQKVQAGLWWGKYALNGQPIKKIGRKNQQVHREDYEFPLRQGWNLLTCQYGVIWGSWDFYMSLPADQNIIVSATREDLAKGTFYTYCPKDLQLNAAIKALNLSTLPTEKINGKAIDWTLQKPGLANTSPARDLAWTQPELQHPIKLKKNGKLKLPPSETGTVIYANFREIQLGRLFIEGQFPEGTIIDIGFSEELNKDGFPYLYRREQINAGIRYITSKDIQSYETFKPYGAKYLKIIIRNPGGTAKIHQIGTYRQVFPFETAGSFHCSDTNLNKIWEAGWRTLQLCAEDSYTDTPFRERGLYAGDMLPEVAITMATTGDLRLAEYSLAVFQDMYYPYMYENYDGVHMDFPFITLLTMNYVKDYSGDWSLIEKYYDNYKNLLLTNLNRKNGEGLIEAHHVFTEWSKINKTDAAMGSLQAIIYQSMSILKTWALHLNKPEEEIAFYESEMTQLKSVFNRLLWDDSRGLYYDGIKQGELIDDQHLSTSIWAMLYGLTNPEQNQRIEENLSEELKDIGQEFRGRKIASYSSYYLFAYLYQQGKTALADEFMKAHWGKMVEGRAYPTVWENFDIDHNQGTSSHAWSGHPTYFLSTEILGVNLGFNKPFDRNIIEIMPQSSYLDWAKGTVMHPLGPVEVSWEVHEDKLYVDYRAPKGAKVFITPRGRLSDLKLIINQKALEVEKVAKGK
ncbi:trehalase family glycosidase [Persicobacter diffluens]|uniref:Alpha-L-rhamnosidase n=1 Tax=Persicobacter diffluens TaxID=981 RepID=A0AAN4W468_9BACT|nr:hypothetical protein PEDI_48750 [Persicobacter diffluens]